MIELTITINVPAKSTFYSTGLRYSSKSTDRQTPEEVRTWGLNGRNVVITTKKVRKIVWMKIMRMTIIPHHRNSDRNNHFFFFTFCDSELLKTQNVCHKIYIDLHIFTFTPSKAIHSLRRKSLLRTKETEKMLLSRKDNKRTNIKKDKISHCI